MNLPVGLQLYTLRQETGDDFPGTLKKAAEAGYRGVEFAGYGDITARHMKGYLNSNGLESISSHIDIGLLRDKLDEMIEYNLELGSRYIVCPYSDFTSKEDYIKTAHFLEAAGEKCLQNGLKLCYHNHMHEFKVFDGEYGLDILYANADQQKLWAEIDTCWVYCSGLDPAEYLRKYTGRCRLVHIKDVKSRESGELTEAGNGVINIKAVAAAAKEAGAEWLIVEQDTCSIPPFESINISMRNLRKLGLA